MTRHTLYIRSLIVSIVLLAASTLRAQGHAEALLSESSISIGGQTTFELRLTQPAGQLAFFPYFSGTIVQGVEVVGGMEVDTVKADDGNIVVAQRYVITSFDDSLYTLPPFPIAISQDTLWTQSLALNVIQPFDLDSADESIFDIKPILTPPNPWDLVGSLLLHRPLVLLNIVLTAARVHYWWTCIILLSFLLLVGGTLWWVYYGRNLKKKPKDKELQQEELPQIPAHLWALEQLDIIKAERRWNVLEEQKQYYSELTEVLRSYIERAYGISCLEMPTSDIIYTLHSVLLDKPEAYQTLRHILQEADLIKFAKWKATTEDSEQALREAYSFVRQTAPTTEQTPQS